MNKTLKFSWGHIIAFLAVIFIGYLSFVGLVYLNDGDFVISLVETIGVVAVVMALCLTLQLLKATERKFEARIRLERVLLCVAPLIFVAVMVPYMHFWTVHAHDNELVGEFTDAIQLSSTMFADYERYTDARLDSYSSHLDQVINRRAEQPQQYAAAGFNDLGDTASQKANMMRALQLQLRSSNYDSLHREATAWIASASQGASSWNVFLLGNTKQISHAIGEWDTLLQAFAEPRLTNEAEPTADAPTLSSDSAHRAQEQLASMQDRYNTLGMPTITAILTTLLLMLAIGFPWVLQDRHTKSMYTLTGNKFMKDAPIDQPALGAQGASAKGGQTNADDDNGYGGFTL